MAFDTTKWLVDEMGFTAEQAAALAPQFADRAAKLEAGYVGSTERQRFATQQAEVSSAQAALKDANDKLNAEMAEWAALSSKEKSEATELREALEASRVRVTQIETRLGGLATQYGFDPKTVLDGAVVIPPKKEEVVAPVDTSKFVARDQIVPVLDYQLELPAMLQYLADQHHELFGQRLDTREIVKEIKARAAAKNGDIDPVRIWEEKFGVPAKRTEVAKAKYDADIAAAEARGREAGLSERAMPGPQNPGRHSPIFRNGEGQFAPRTSRLQRPVPESGVRSAAQSLATHKYAVKETGAR